jgi:hypothetical protein
MLPPFPEPLQTPASNHRGQITIGYMVVAGVMQPLSAQIEKGAQLAITLGCLGSLSYIVVSRFDLQTIYK